MLNPDSELRLAANMLDMLRNDMRTIIECRCEQHGVSGDGPNFTAVLICLVACDVAGILLAAPQQRDRAAVAAFIATVGHEAGDARYATCASALLAFFRDGIAHGFLPKRVPSPRGVVVTANVVWPLAKPGRSLCVDWLSGTSAGRRRLRSLRHQHHLQVVKNRKENSRRFEVVPHVLFLDVDRQLHRLEAALAAKDPATTATVLRNARKLATRGNAMAQMHTTTAAWTYLLRGK